MPDSFCSPREAVCFFVLPDLANSIDELIAVGVLKSCEQLASPQAYTFIEWYRILSSDVG